MQDRMMSRGAPSRRDLVVTAGATAVALVGGTGFAQRLHLANGTIFEDSSGTGQRQVSDRGVAGVLVSNGRDVTATDAYGRYRLPMAASDCIFVIKPPHWTTPVRSSGIPSFSLDSSGRLADPHN